MNSIQLETLRSGYADHLLRRVDQLRETVSGKIDQARPLITAFREKYVFLTVTAAVVVAGVALMIILNSNYQTPQQIEAMQELNSLPRQDYIALNDGKLRKTDEIVAFGGNKDYRELKPGQIVSGVVFEENKNWVAIVAESNQGQVTRALFTDRSNLAPIHRQGLGY